MTTAPTTQREMHAVLARCHAPTLPLAAFAAHCGEAAAAVREWCELDRLYVGANKIDFAWDIGTGRHRDEVRIPSYYLVPEHRLQVLPEEIHHVPALVRRTTGEELEEGHAERVDVAAGIDLIAHDLLGRHVRR